MRELKYAEILAQNVELGKSLTSKPYRIAVLGNVMTHQLNEILEFALRSRRVNAAVESGDYDNIAQDAVRFADRDLVVIFWELCNIVDGFQAKAGIMEEAALADLLAKVKAEIDFTLAQLKQTPLVIFNRFSSLVFAQSSLRPGAFEKAAAELNAHLEKSLPKNAVLLDIEKLLARVSVRAATDFRYYYSSKALYTPDFFKEYALAAADIAGAVQGRAKKVLIFDCDNTLWKGVLGEDGPEGIEMSLGTPSGAVFHEIQSIAVELSKRGILICLCSKNNAADVDAVLDTHPDMVLKNEHITLKKVDWADKLGNIAAIAKELNLGLDSLVFVDDTDFEVTSIRERLPEVTVLQVPKKLHHYPAYLREHLGLFFTPHQSAEDLRRTALYQEEQRRESERGQFASLEEYLASLELKLLVYCNDTAGIGRAAQLTQKTNQFNLTTRRYTEQEMGEFHDSDTAAVYAFEVRDRFGDYGRTGLCIVHLDAKRRHAHIDTFLMSCRVIGRKIEVAFLTYILAELKRDGIDDVEAEFIPTAKNAQVECFYEQVGFQVVEESKACKRYRCDLRAVKFPTIEFIEITDGRANSKSDVLGHESAGIVN